MNRRAAALLLGSVFVLAVTALVVRRGTTELDTPVTTAGESAELSDSTVAVQLYFPDANGRLSTELREIPSHRETGARLRAILTELLAGPTDESRFAPLAPPVEIAGIHVSLEGTAYIDLGSSEHPTPPVTGTHDELLAVYSLVNSLLLNTPEVEAIALLWNGQQLESFAGHIDTTRPLVANPNL